MTVGRTRAPAVTLSLSLSLSPSPSLLSEWWSYVPVRGLLVVVVARMRVWRTICARARARCASEADARAHIRIWTYRNQASDTAAYSTCATVNVRRYNQSNQLMIRLSDRAATRVPHPELWQATRSPLWILRASAGGIWDSWVLLIFRKNSRD